MISEVMSFVCSDSCENGITKEKVRTKDQANYRFQSISGSKAMNWNFQIVKYLDEFVQQYSGRKSGGREAEFQVPTSKKGFEKNEHAYNVEGVSWVSDSTARPYLKVAGPTWKIQSSSKLRQFRK